MSLELLVHLIILIHYFIIMINFINFNGILMFLTQKIKIKITSHPFALYPL